MKRLRIVRLLVPLAMLFLVGKAYAVVTPAPFPSLKVAGIKKGEISQKTLKGKVTVINLWATWCEACKIELKEMETVFKPLLKNKDFKFAMVSLDKDPDKAVEWIKGNMKNPAAAMKMLYKDPDFKLAEAFAGETFPVTLVVDQNGQVIHFHEGFEEGSDQTHVIKKQVEKLLKK